MKFKRANGKIIFVSVFVLLALLAVWLWGTNQPTLENLVKRIPNNAVGTNQQPAARSSGISPASNEKVSLATNGTATNSPVVTGATNNPPAPMARGLISDNALKQIGALEAEKAKRTPVQQKIDSQLLYADKMQRGEPIAEGVPTLRVNLDKDDQGRILVDIKAEVTNALLQYIKTLGGNVINSFPQYQAIRASVPLANIENLAARGDVRFIGPAVHSMKSTVDSEGDYTHQAYTARSTFGVNGSGLKIGVLSDSVDYLSSSQIAGKVTVLSGQSGLGQGYSGEGTAMLEIVNDLAPGAQLYFATGFGSDANFANNIQQLTAAGCNIIVDDVLNDDESPFQDGIIAQAVNSVTASGVLYFSSASNSGNEDSGTSGTWEGDFVDSGDINDPVLPAGSGHVHSFNGSLYDTVLGPGPAGDESSLRVDLFWADPLGASTNDYDVYVLDPTGTTVVDVGGNFQTGTQDPYEHCTLYSGDLIVIVKFSGAGRFLHLSTGRGELAISTQGSTRGHDCATNAFCVAATSALNSFPSAFTGGAANPVEDFSSDGPRRVFFHANGAPITPGNFSSSGGAVRQKPEITAADQITTDVPGFAPFGGTSAAAPHAAAIAALLKSSNPSLTPSQIRTILTNTALNIMSAGVDRDSGAGIVMALAALQAAPHPDLTKRTDSLNNLSPHAGDVVTASLTITNQSCSGGNANAGMFHVGFYGLSTSTSFTGLSPFYELAVNGCTNNKTVSTNLNITIDPATTPGTYYLGYKINDENEVSECNENNNGIFYWTVTVLVPAQADLTKRTDSLNNPSPHAGDMVTTSITITNQSCSGGSATAGAFHVGFYWSTSSGFPGISPFDETLVSGCAANGTVSFTNHITIGAGTAPGTYYLGYKIDDENEVPECNEGNNGFNYWTITVIPDTNPPTINIMSPTSGQRWSNAVFTVNGTASDNVAVTNVIYSLNGLAWTAATTGNSWSNWTAQPTLTPGTNTVAACSVDSSSNISITNTASFQFVVTNQLQLRTIGLGTFLPNYSNAWLEVGRNYSVTSTPASGFVFTNWLVSTNWIGGATTSKTNLQFMMASNLTLQANFIDVTKPTVSITNLATGQRVSNAVFTVKGTATDNWQVSNVVCQLNNTGWTNASGANPWSMPFTLIPGTNLVAAYAVDTTGNLSTTNSVSFQCVVTNQLQIRATGLGTVSPNYSNSWLEIGRNYSVTSTPASGFVFTNWIVSTNWLGGTTANKTNLQFMMASNLTLQANFLDVTKPTNTIMAPTANQKMTNAIANVVGTATDNWKVIGVWCQLNSNAWNLVSTTNGYTNWTQTLTLIAGTNTIKAYAQDLGGNYSTTNSLNVVSSNTFKLQLGFSVAQPLTSNGLNFSLQISSNLNGHIQVSTNLLNWISLTNFVGTNTTLNFRDSAATNFNQRFYRAVIP